MASSPGIRTHTTPHGISVIRVHYSADPEKGGGDPIFVPDLNRSISPWAFGQYKQMTDPSLYLREYEIEAEATLGALLYYLDDEATLEKSFPIPKDWTRRMALDPHPGVPHAFLWCATDPWGDRWYYRELWPSKACFRYVDGKLSGKAGPCPSDDLQVSIREYVETVKWLESEDNPENVADGKPFTEKIYARVIDYAARAFGQGTNDDPEQPNFQTRYESWMLNPKTRVSCPVFEDAKKDHDVGFEMVNNGLKPRKVMGNSGEFDRRRSQIHIFKDRCPELIWQLKNARRQQLTPQQAQTKDPSGQPVNIRLHMVDDMRYIEMANPIYIRHNTDHVHLVPPHAGLSY